MRRSYPPAVVFDNDGVLVDSEPLINHVLAEMLTGIGLTMSKDEVESHFLGQTFAAVLDWIGERSARVPEDFESLYHQRLEEQIAKGVNPVEGVREAVEDLQNEGVLVAVASNSDRAWVLGALRAAGLEDLTSAELVVTVDDVEHGKPAPDLYLTAAGRVGQPASSCVAVDDSGPGIESARRAGMATIGFARRTPPRQLRHANETIRSMDRLLVTIEEVWMNTTPTHPPGDHQDDRVH